MVEDVVRSFGYLTLGTRLKRIGERLQADTQKIIDGGGGPLQASQYPLLAALDRAGPLTIGELSEALGTSQPGVTRMVAQLVKAGLLRTEQGAEDQRRRIVSLTAEGESLIAAAKREIWPRVTAAVADLCDDLGGPLLEQLAAMEDGLSTLPLDRRRARAKGKAKR